MAKAVVMIPTYNEYGNIRPLVARLLALPIEVDLFFVDDGSPDHTGELLDSLHALHPRLRVLHRSGKLGLGTAYRQAAQILLKEPYEYFFTMDADLSHSPETIPDLLRTAENGDLVIGSRYVPGGGVRNCSLARRLLSRTANHMARLLLRLKVRDATGGFRCYRRDLLSALGRVDVCSNGYSYLIEMTFYAKNMGFRIQEVPIVFEDRVSAKSKMSRAEVVKAMGTLLRLWVYHMSGWGARNRMRFAEKG